MSKKQFWISCLGGFIGFCVGNTVMELFLKLLELL